MALNCCSGLYCHPKYLGYEGKKKRSSMTHSINPKEDHFHTCPTAFRLCSNLALPSASFRCPRWDSAGRFTSTSQNPSSHPKLLKGAGSCWDMASAHSPASTSRARALLRRLLEKMFFLCFLKKISQPSECLENNLNSCNSKVIPKPVSS